MIKPTFLKKSSVCNIERVRIEPCLFRSKVPCVLKFEGTTLHARLREAGSSQLAKKKKEPGFWYIMTKSKGIYLPRTCVIKMKNFTAPGCRIR